MHIIHLIQFSFQILLQQTIFVFIFLFFSLELKASPGKKKKKTQRKKREKKGKKYISEVGLDYEKLLRRHYGCQTTLVPAAQNMHVI